jgi:hypothetical protein
MSNLFNSRFAALIEDNPPSNPFTKYNKKGNTGKDKDNKSKNNYLNSENNSKVHHKNDRENNKVNKIVQKEEKTLTAEYFPDLLNTAPIKETPLPENSYIEKVKTIKPEVIIKDCHIKPGWVEIKRDLKKKKIVTTYSDEMNDNNENSDNLCIDILTALVDLHNKRTNEYIELWGYDQWEKTFISPSYDYEYFDKLDQKYNEEINEMYANENE